MRLCKDIKFNHQNQERLYDYIFGSNYEPSDVKVLSSEKFEIHIENKGEKSFDNVNYYLFDYEKIISSGSYGTVLKFVDKKKNVALALKMTRANDENLISDKLNQSDCGILRVKYSEKDFIGSNFAYFMELADGDLEDFFLENLQNMNDNPGLFLDIFETIRKQLICLFELDNRYVYTDMKPNNVLYKCDKNKEIKFFLGDLGSAVSDNEKDYIATYPPIGSTYGFFKLNSVLKKKGALGWSLGILILISSLYYYKKNRSEIQTGLSYINNSLLHNNILYLTKNDMEQFKLSLNSFQNNIYNDTNRKKPDFLFSDYFDSDPEVRGKALYMSLKISSSQKPSPSQQSITKLSLLQLRSLAKKKGLKGYSKMKKSELIQYIKHGDLKPSPSRQSISKLGLLQLQSLAKKKGLKGYSKMKKSELIQYIKHGDLKPSPSQQSITKLTVLQLQFLAKKKGLKGYSKMKKSELIRYIKSIM
jgi:hypothetical protein